MATEKTRNEIDQMQRQDQQRREAAMEKRDAKQSEKDRPPQNPKRRANDDG